MKVAIAAVTMMLITAGNGLSALVFARTVGFLGAGVVVWAGVGVVFFDSETTVALVVAVTKHSS